MAKLTKQKAQKEYICYKCKRTITKGEIYQKIIERYIKPKTVCCDCVVTRSELTGSEYLAWLFDLQDNFIISTPDDVEELIEILEDQKCELEDRFENIPEQFQDGFAGSTLQERIDSLDDAISSLESLDFECYEEDDENDEDPDFESELDEARSVLSSIE